MLYSNVSIIKDVMLKCVCIRFKRNLMLVPWNKEETDNLWQARLDFLKMLVLFIMQETSKQKNYYRHFKHVIIDEDDLKSGHCHSVSSLCHCRYCCNLEISKQVWQPLSVQKSTGNHCWFHSSYTHKVGSYTLKHNDFLMSKLTSASTAVWG